jgi:hypothetical protein
MSSISKNWIESYLVKDGEASFLFLSLLTFSIIQILFYLTKISKKLFSSLKSSIYSSSLVQSKAFIKI